MCRGLGTHKGTRSGGEEEEAVGVYGEERGGGEKSDEREGRDDGGKKSKDVEGHKKVGEERPDRGTLVPRCHELGLNFGSAGLEDEYK